MASRQFVEERIRKAEENISKKTGTISRKQTLITKKGRTTMIRVTKPIARRLFRQGKVIHLVPCKCRPEDWKPVCINQESDEMFDRLVSDFIVTNCNDKEGYYPHYYIEEGE